MSGADLLGWIQARDGACDTLPSRSLNWHTKGERGKEERGVGVIGGRKRAHPTQHCSIRFKPSFLPVQADSSGSNRLKPVVAAEEEH